MTDINMKDVYGTMDKMRDSSYLEKCAECELVNHIPDMFEFIITSKEMCLDVYGDHMVHPLKWKLKPVSTEAAAKALKYNGKLYRLESISLNTLDRHSSRATPNTSPSRDEIRDHLKKLHLLIKYKYYGNNDHELMIIVPFGIHEGRKNDLLSEKLAWPIEAGLDYHASHQHTAKPDAQNYCVKGSPRDTGALPMHLLFEHLARGDHFYASTQSRDLRVLWFKEMPISVDLGARYEELVECYWTRRGQDEWMKEFVKINPTDRSVTWRKADYRASSKVVDLSELSTKRMKCRPLRLGPKHAVSANGSEEEEDKGKDEENSSVGKVSAPVWALAATLIVALIAIVALLCVTDFKNNFKKIINAWFRRK